MQERGINRAFWLKHEWTDILMLLLCCSLFFIPFYEYKEFSVLKWIFERYNLPLLAVVMIFLLSLKPGLDHKEIQFNLVDFFLLAYFLYVVFNITLNDPILFHFRKFKELLALAVIYITIRLWASSIPDENLPRFINILFLAFFLTVSLQGVIAILQLTGHITSNDPTFRLSGTFDLVSHLAFYMGIGFPLAAGVYTLHHRSVLLSRTLRYCCLLVIVLSAFILPIIQNRSSWIMAITGLLFICSVRFYQGYRMRIRKLFAKRWFLIAFALGAFLLLLASGRWLYYFKQNSADGRVLIWKVLLEKGWESVAWGQGYNQVELKYGAWLINWFENDKGTQREQMLADPVRVSYNEFLEIFVETGAPGLLLFLGIIFALFYVWPLVKKTENKIILFGAIVTILTCSIFSFPFSLPVINTIFIFCIALISSQVQGKVYAFTSRPLYRLAFAFFIIIAAVPVSLHIYNQTKAYEKFRFGRQLYLSHQFQDALVYYSEYKEQFKYDPILQEEYALTLFHLGRYQKSIAVLNHIEKISPTMSVYIVMGNNYKALGKYAMAEWAYMKAFHLAPSRFYPLYLIAKMHFDAGNTQKSKAMAQQIIAKAVKVDSPAIREIKKEMELMLKKINKESEV